MEILRIAICEDDTAEQNILSSLLEKSSVPTSRVIYSSGEEFLKSYYPGCCDLILMDIYMGGMNGVETVAQIRAKDSQVPIAFMTTSPDFTMDGYRYRVDRYLLKPVKLEDLDEVLLLAERSKNNHPSVTLSIQGKERSIPHASIVYGEQDAHTIYLHLTNGETLKAIMKLSSLADLLPSPPFYQFHKSFLVNLMQVLYLDSDLKAFVMDGGGYAYIRRDSLRDAQNTYSSFMFDQIRKQEKL